MLDAVGASSSSASIRSGSKAAASRVRFEFTPSIQMVSELTRKNGASPRSGSALTMPPPVPSSSLRSSENTMRGRCRAGEVTLDLVGQVMDIDHGLLDPGGRQPVEHVVDQRLVADLDQRLRNRAVERPHARAKPGREHHGVFRRGQGSPHVGGAICYRVLKLSLTMAHWRCTRPAAARAPDGSSERCR